MFALVHSVGGDLNINVYPDIVSVDAVVPATQARRVVAAMTAAYFAPAISDSSVQAAQRDAAVLARTATVYGRATLQDTFVRTALLGRTGTLSADSDHGRANRAHYAGRRRYVCEARVSLEQRRARRSPATSTRPASTPSTDGGGSAGSDAPIDSTLGIGPAASMPSTVSADGFGLAWAGPPIADESSDRDWTS